MSGYDDHDLLTTTLRDRAGDMDGHTLGLDDVKGRARGIRRRRRAMTGAVAAAVLAVAVPVGLNVSDVDRGQQPLPTNPSPSVVETPEPSPSGPVTIDAAAAPRGEDPAILYADGTTLHRPGQPDVELPQQYSYLLPYADGVMGFYGPDGTTTIVDGSGNAVGDPWPGISGAVSSDGQSLATVLYAGGSNVDRSSGRAPVRTRTRATAATSSRSTATSSTPASSARETVAYNLTVSNNQGATQKPYVASWNSNDEPRQLTSLMDVRGTNDVTGVVSGLDQGRLLQERVLLRRREGRVRHGGVGDLRLPPRPVQPRREVCPRRRPARPTASADHGRDHPRRGERRRGRGVHDPRPGLHAGRDLGVRLDGARSG